MRSWRLRNLLRYNRTDYILETNNILETTGKMCVGSILDLYMELLLIFLDVKMVRKFPYLWRFRLKYFRVKCLVTCNFKWCMSTNHYYQYSYSCAVPLTEHLGDLVSVLANK